MTDRTDDDRAKPVDGATREGGMADKDADYHHLSSEAPAEGGDDTPGPDKGSPQG